MNRAGRVAPTASANETRCLRGRTSLRSSAVEVTRRILGKTARREVEWPPHESGTFQAQDTALSKAGNAYLRYYLIEAANSVRLHCAEYRDYYNAKLAQSPKHAHKRALVLTARKLVRLVDALLRAGAVYQPQDRKEGQTTPHAARPRPHRRARLVASAS